LLITYLDLSTEIDTDPLNALGGIGEAGKALSLPRQLSKVLEGTNSVRATDEAMQAGATEAARGVSSPLVRQAADVVRPTEQAVQQSTLLPTRLITLLQTIYHK
jgi:hypothetical protein